MTFRNLTDISYTDTQKLDLYLPDCEGKAPLFIFFHGGGIENGDKADPGSFAELAESGIAVASANYRLYPEAKFPEFIEDAAAAVAWCMKKSGEEFSGVYVGGSSAGSNLSMMLAFDEHYLMQYGISPNEIDGYFFDAGQPTTHYNVLRERGLDTRLVRVDEAAPIYFLKDAKDVEKFPKYLFIVTDNDMPVRLEQNVMMIKTMEHFGYPKEKIQFLMIPGYEHTGYMGVKNADGTSFYAKLIRSFIGG